MSGRWQAHGNMLRRNVGGLLLCADGTERRQRDCVTVVIVADCVEHIVWVYAAAAAAAAVHGGNGSCSGSGVTVLGAHRGHRLSVAVFLGQRRRQFTIAIELMIVIDNCGGRMLPLSVIRRRRVAVILRCWLRIVVLVLLSVSVVTVCFWR